MLVSASMVLGFLGEKLADKALEASGGGLWRRIANRAARTELATACAVAIEAAAERAPAIAADLRSESFCDGVVLPLVRNLLERPSALVDADTLAAHYVTMFVEQFTADDDSDATLVRLFQTDRTQLVAGFEAFLARLKDELYAGTHWRDAQHYVTTEVTAARLDHLIAIVEADRAEVRARRVDVDRAITDAAIASAGLRAWPGDIHGLRLETPALDRLLARVQAEPAGRTILVGEGGSGKSALLARLADMLEQAGITVFAIKADQLPASLVTLDDLSRALGVAEGLEDRISALAAGRPVALLLDQLDAVSDVMDRRSHRMQVLLQLIHRLDIRATVDGRPRPVHVIVSSRPFEAAHDARFRQLRAETLAIDLLSDDQVTAMLAHLGQSVEAVEPGLRRTLRRPFALKLYADIVTRGGIADTVTPAGLLDAWAASADLGDAAERRDTGEFLLALAGEMIATETLWRPADAFDLRHGAAVQRAVAAGLALRADERIGFTHQSWLDDFQAKTFSTGRDLATYAWERQDSLFMRAGVLRGLERLRLHDVRGYAAALDALLGSGRSRRHLLHLVADLIATVADPMPFEIGWVVQWIHGDLPLASRAIGQIVPRWERWRDGLIAELPTVMTAAGLDWHAAQLLAAEVALDPDRVARLIDRHWSDPTRDRLVFQILELADFAGLDVRARLGTIFARTAIDDHSVANMIRVLRIRGRCDDAVAVMMLWLAVQEIGRHDQPALYGLEELVEAAPLAFARAMLPWVVALAAREVEPANDRISRYPRSATLPWSGLHFDREGSPFAALRQALALLGERDPAALWGLLEPTVGIEIDEVHELIVIGLAAAGSALAREAIAYLLADSRRLHVSHIIAGRDGVITTVDGWHSQALIRAIAPALDDAQLGRLRDAIERWCCYPDDVTEPDDPETTARRHIWCDHARLPLLECLPPHLLTLERREAIRAWRLEHPVLDPAEADDMGGWVGPPVTHEEMADLDDDALLALLNEFHDDSGKHRWTRPISRAGGVEELARAFATFGKADRARAVTLAERLSNARHQRAAGALVRELAEGEGGDPAAVLRLILDLNRRGFTSKGFRQEAASALQKLAVALDGLDDAVVALLEGWIETDPATIARQVAERTAFEARNPRDDGTDSDPRPLLFGSGGGMEILPSDNFTILSAIAAALFRRPEPAFATWAAVLECHLDRPEDPAVWSAILRWRGDPLRVVDPRQVARLLDRLWDRYPAALCDVRLVRFWWQLWVRIPDHVKIGAMVRWMAAGGLRERRAASEVLTAAQLVDRGSALDRLLFGRLDRSDPAVETGVLFTAARAWEESDPTIRAAAHALLMATLPEVAGPPARALGQAMARWSRLPADTRTTALLTALAGNDAVLRPAFDHRFCTALQTLLLYPGFDAAVLAVVERATVLVVDAGERWGVGQELVPLAVALQRADGTLRSRAMDVYERLLDAAIYGAEEAARASLSRAA